MAQRRLGKQMRSSLTRMVETFAKENDSSLPSSDKHILTAIHSELQSADKVDLSISMSKQGSVRLQCNGIKYTFDDPSLKKAPK